MKRIYAFSDTHGYRNGFDIFLARTPDADAYAHLGDYASDAEAFAPLTKKPFYSVRGNGDFGSDKPLEEIITLEGARILLLHGHTCAVKYGLQRLLYRALELEAQAVLYGHTHAADIAFEQGICLVCPGAMGRSRATYASLTVEDGMVTPKLFCL